jgi:hypothetical protein
MALSKITTNSLAANAVTSAAIANGEIALVDLASNSVGSDQIVNDAVTSAKIATGAVTSTEIASSISITELSTTRSNTIAVNANNYVLGAISGNITINVAQSTYFSVNTTNSSTFFFEGAPDSSKATGFVLEITSGGGNGVNTFTQTWPAAVKWPSGTAPTLTDGAANVDVLVFITDDSGTTWRGAASQLDSY